jgi:phospholipid/cholesterol/gamma-HCH transport system ATP-binding protein
MIKVTRLNKRFGGQQVLDNINLEIREGELLVILGESGSGKSVLLQHLIGLIKPDEGTVEIDGRDITKLPEKELLKVRRHIGYLFQDGALYDFMTVFENVAFPLREHTRAKPREIKAKVLELLKTVGLEGAEGKFPSQLSGGMRKRAALARSVILDSRVLFCDEPTSGLDPIKSRSISDLIKGIGRQLKCTTVVTSHDIQNSFRIADRLILIREGKIVAEGVPAQLQASHDSYLQEFLT